MKFSYSELYFLLSEDLRSKHFICCGKIRVLTHSVVPRWSFLHWFFAPSIFVMYSKDLGIIWPIFWCVKSRQKYVWNIWPKHFDYFEKDSLSTVEQFCSISVRFLISSKHYSFPKFIEFSGLQSSTFVFNCLLLWDVTRLFASNAPLRKRELSSSCHIPSNYHGAPTCGTHNRIRCFKKGTYPFFDES